MGGTVWGGTEGHREQTSIRDGMRTGEEAVGKRQDRGKLMGSRQREAGLEVRRIRRRKKEREHASG